MVTVAQPLLMVVQVLIMVVEGLVREDRVTMGSGKLPNIVATLYTMVVAVEETEVVGQNAIVMTPTPIQMMPYKTT